MPRVKKNTKIKPKKPPRKHKNGNLENDFELNTLYINKEDTYAEIDDEINKESTATYAEASELSGEILARPGTSMDPDLGIIYNEADDVINQNSGSASLDSRNIDVDLSLNPDLDCEAMEEDEGQNTWNSLQAMVSIEDDDDNGKGCNGNRVVVVLLVLLILGVIAAYLMIGLQYFGIIGCKTNEGNFS